MKIPELGVGTWTLYGKECEEVVRQALEVGYRHIDTAFAYENHEAVGRAIKGFDREELFITSKIVLGAATEGAFSVSHIDKDNVKTSANAAVDLALKELDTDYLDAMLIHWPNRKMPMVQIMEALQKNPKVHAIGGSNFTAHHLQDFYNAGLHIDYNQVEFHPYLYQKELLRFCQEHGATLIAYRPFGKGKLLAEEPLFAEIGTRHGKSATQVVLRWFLQKGVPVIAKSTSRAHLEQNFQIFDFTLTSQEMQSIDRLNRNKRFCDQPWAEFDY